jgi:hypothetical protein
MTPHEGRAAGILFSTLRHAHGEVKIGPLRACPRRPTPPRPTGQVLPAGSDGEASHNLSGSARR